MALSLNNGAQYGGVQAAYGPELQEIQTDQLGFQALNGDAKLRLLPTPWPEDDLPEPTSSLLTVASSRGLVAAAGPEGIVIATTNAVREAIASSAEQGENMRTIEPAVKIPLSRTSHLVFSSDETALVASLQQDGGIVAYQVEELLKGNTRPALEIATNGEGLRALIPNPMPQTAHQFAAVTRDGKLLVADLKSGALQNATDGPVWADGVTCVSWSKLGKALIAGLADGSGSQIKSDGTFMAQIPSLPSTEVAKHVSALSWLEKDTFFVIYNPNEGSGDGLPPSSEYYLISRQKGTTKFAFQRLPEVVPPFGVERFPPFHFICRLRSFPPDLDDLLLVTSTISVDVGMVTKATVALSKGEPVIGDYSTTTVMEDSRRAQLPLKEDGGGDTSPIGFAVDLSSRDTIYNPIPSDPEIQESATPLPSLLILNNEGILVVSSIVYNSSIRAKTAYPGLVALSSTEQTPQSKSQTPESTTLQTPAQTPSVPTFGQAVFGDATSFAKPPASTFGAPAADSSFGRGNTTFGTPATMSGTKSSWADTGFGSSTSQTGASGVGQPAFGPSTAVGASAAPAFGASSTLGSRPAAFGQATSATTPAFGKPAGLGSTAASLFGGGSAASPFTARAGDVNKTAGFGAFSGAGGFGSSASTKTGEGGVFGKPAESVSSGTKPTPMSGSGDTKQGQDASLFGAPKGGFKLESSFKPDVDSRKDMPKESHEGALSFGGGFGDLMGESRQPMSPTHDKEADMGVADGTEGEPADHIATDDAQVPPSAAGPSSLVTPPSTITQSKATPAPPLSGLFGEPAQSSTIPEPQRDSKAGDVKETTTPAPSAPMFGTSTQPGTTPAAVQASIPSWSFAPQTSTTPKESPLTKKVPFPARERSPDKAPRIKAEPPSDDETQDLSNIPEAPLPPDPTSKAAYAAGDTSGSSDNSKLSDDALLPPDFVPANKSAGSELEEGEVPEDEEFSSDYEGSEEDASGEISPIEEPPAEPTEQIQTSPESSFGRSGEKSQENSPTGGIFTKVTPIVPSQQKSRPLFGEVGSGPVFPPPKPQESPRSPSPVRNLLPEDLLRPEPARSVSAPSRPSAIDTRRAELAKSNLRKEQAPTGDRNSKDDQRRAAAAEAKAKAEADEQQELEDDEDERLRAELAKPVSPVEELEQFVHYEHGNFEEVSSKSGIPGQIERLYNDVNAMIDTLGINARSLSGFMLYQQGQEPSEDWPAVLESETPLDSLNDQWVLDDIVRLREGSVVLEQMSEETKVANVTSKLQQCRELLVSDIVQLKTKLIALRKSIHGKDDYEINFKAPLSAEQASLQNDLRKASTSVQTKMTQAEQVLSMLRARIAEIAPPQSDAPNGFGKPSLSRAASQRKPTVQAVTNTIAKMTSMAEKKSTEIDYLEAQLKKFGLMPSSSSSHEGSTENNGTPQKQTDSSAVAKTPASGTGTVYHTPGSKFANSVRSTPGTGRSNFRTSLADIQSSVSEEDRDRWRAKAQRKHDVTRALKEALEDKRKKARAIKAK